MVKLGFIGAGTVGNALAIRLREKGYPVVATSSRSHSSAEKLAERVAGCTAVGKSQDVADAAELVFITTPDNAIAQVAGEVNWHPGQGVVHCCGAESTAILEAVRNSGAHTGAFHPLQSFASLEKALENIPGSTIAIEADAELMETLKGIARDLEGHWIELKAEHRAVYHASAVIACNYLVTLEKLATDIWHSFGIPRRQAIQALLPLVKGTIRNIENVGIPDCLTGPIARGDVATVKKHLEELALSSPELISTYRELGLQTIPIALEKGKIDEDSAGELEALLSSQRAD